MSDPREPQVEVEDDLADNDIIDNEGGDEADEGQDADLGEEEAEAGEDQDEAQARVEPRRRSSARDTITTLRRRAQEAETRLADLERRVTAPAPVQQVDPQAQARADAAEDRRMRDELAPSDYVVWRAERDQRNYQNQLFQMELRNADRFDQSNFRQLKASNPAAARLEPRVEAMLSAARAQGMYALTREDCFYRIYGEELANRARQQAPRQRAAAARRVQGQTTRPANARGDVARSGGNRVDADEQLLRSATIRDGLR